MSKNQKPNRPREPNRQKQREAQLEDLQRRIGRMPLEKQARMRAIELYSHQLPHDELIYIVLRLVVMLEGY